MENCKFQRLCCYFKCVRYEEDFMFYDVCIAAGIM